MGKGDEEKRIVNNNDNNHNDEISCEDDKRLRLRSNDRHIELSNTIKSFHYRLQQRMSAKPGGVAQKEEEQESEETRWSRLIAEESEHMKAYAAAMHDIATCYWDSHQNGEAKEKEKGEQEEYREGGVSGCPSHATSSVDTVTETRTRHRCNSNEAEGITQDNNRQPACGSLRYNDRVAYSLHCVADYYLGTCLPIVHASEGHQHPEHCHDKQRQSGGDIDASSGKKDSENISIVPCKGIYEHIPRIAVTFIKSWRRDFYTLHGHPASPSEVETAAYHALIQSDSGEGTNKEYDTTVAFASLSPNPLLITKHHQEETKRTAALLAATYMSMTRDEVNRSRFMGSSSTSSSNTPVEISLPLRVLDVGSCYGPFKGKYVTNMVVRVPLTVTALDLCPFEGSDVLKGDWLSVRFHDVGGTKKEKNPEETEAENNASVNDDNDDIHATDMKTKSFIQGSENSDVKSTPGKSLSLPRGQFDAVFFCLMLSFLPHPRLRYRACLHAHLALKDGGLLVVVSTRTQGARRGSWIDDWITCIEGIGFRRVHKHIMGQIVGMSFSKKSSAAESEGGAAAWLEDMMARPEAEVGLRILGDNFI